MTTSLDTSHQLDFANLAIKVKDVDVAGALSVVGNVAVTGTLTVTGAVSQTAALVPTGGVGPAGGSTISPRCWHTGGNPPSISTDMADGTPSVTETYWAEVFVPANATITGVAIFNGSATGSGNVTVYLASAAGANLAHTASTAVTGTDAYQLVPFSAPLAVTGPATYYVGSQYNNATTHFNFHTIGAFGAGKSTGTVYGTFPTTPTMPTTFTTAQGPVATLY